jgi:hypothetical protein
VLSPAGRPAAPPPADAATEADPSEEAAEPVEAGAGPLADLWPAFLQRLAEQKMSLAAYLADSRPLRQEGSVVTVGLPGFALHQEVLSAADTRKLVEQLLSQVCGAAVTVRYETIAEPSESSGGSKAAAALHATTPPIVQDIVNLFNATLLDKPRPS